jgi:hypothetical protein
VRSASLALVVLVATLSLPRPARADVGSSAESIGTFAAYVGPLACSLFSGGALGAYLVADEGAPARWRTTAYVCGGLSLAVGTYVWIDDGFATARGITLGAVPIVAGAGVITLALLVGAPDDVVGVAGGRTLVTPFVADGGGGLLVLGWF